VQVEHRPMGSTGATAPYYDRCMRNATNIPLCLFLAPLLACAEDAPTRPQDGTVEVWGACAWDGQIEAALCQPDLVCSWHGVCSPTCELAADCPNFEGFDNYCGAKEDALICVPRCDSKKDCPQTEEVILTCIQGFCEGEL
jgi:hypothetical protein